MAIVGFIFCFIVLLIITGLSLVNILWGGSDLGALPAKSYFWFGPFICLLVWGWYLLLINSPFSIVVS